MKEIIFARSPHYYNATNSNYSLIELYIWGSKITGQSIPVTPTFTIERIKVLPDTYLPFDISGYVKVILDTFSKNTAILEDRAVNVTLKFYTSTNYPTVPYSLVETKEYVAVNGYKKLSEVNTTYNLNTLFPLISQTEILNWYKKNATDDGQNMTVLIDHDGTTEYRSRYESLTGTGTKEFTLLNNSNAAGIYVIDIPIAKYTATFSGNDDNGHFLKIRNHTTSTTLYTWTVKPTFETRYTPIRVGYVNEFGGNDTINFYKKSNISSQIKSEKYKVSTLPTVPFVFGFQTEKKININGVRNLQANTGWVNEVFYNKIESLLLSEKVQLYDYLTPKDFLTVKTESLKKQVLDDGLINYSVDFEYQTELIL